ncbi:site-specific integrase [Pseudomonas sp. TH31]|uniref:site-specific integrase n=1 Tax=Pseudomonas sp. TH31 TaxID=2796396 RepID=UPI0019144025|nr:integrase [Pseudomonas sp. TH31]MBK5415071.1 integrase [Pseudomonas sp. TH31]
MRRARKRKHNPHIPAHVDQAALPAAIYFDHRGSGVWYTLHYDETGKQRRKNVAPADVSLAELHRIMDEASNIDRGTLRYVCDQFHLSDRYKKLAPKTHDDYCYSRDVLLNIPTKLSKPLGELAVKKFTAALVQRIVDRLADEGTPSKAAHALRYLRRVLQWGRNRGFLEVNPALGIEAPIERKQRRLPRQTVMDVLIDRATARGRLARNEPGGCPEYLVSVMELAYLCRLRGIEVVTLTDANELEVGILTNRRKGSRDNIVRWTPRLRAVWDCAKALRARTWERRKTPVPIAASKRFIIVANHGGPLRKTSLDTAWQRFITLAISDGNIDPGDRFALHDLKRRGITDTTGTRADKQEASGHRDAKMMDVYDHSVPIVFPSAN